MPSSAGQTKPVGVGVAVVATVELEVDVLGVEVLREEVLRVDVLEVDVLRMDVLRVDVLREDVLRVDVLRVDESRVDELDGTASLTSKARLKLLMKKGLPTELLISQYLSPSTD